MPAKNVRISVIIPAYNEANVLPECLAALKKQTRQADEILIINNGSSDATAVIAEQYGAKVISEFEKGIMPAVYSGFSNADGDIMARCDADSIVPYDWLTKIETAFNDKSVMAVTGPGAFYGVNRLAAKSAQFWYMWPYFFWMALALANWPLFGSNCAIRREVWSAIRPALEKHHGDVHDDVAMSLVLPTNKKVQLLRNNPLGVSARSLDLRGMPERYVKAYRTFRIYWPEQAPWHRWRRRLLGQG